MLHAVLMAGGSGTRFWPASRRDVPKQLLSFTGTTTMIQSTAARLAGLVPVQRQLVVTSTSLVEAITDQLPGVNIVGEPCRRDTAPCVGLAAAIVSVTDPEATLLVMPSDHVISTDAQFGEAVRSGVSLLDEDPGRIVTFGIRPIYAAESFGYIERAQSLPLKGAKAFRVARFREKPNAKTAQQYLDSGNYYWNSGIFLWRARTILELLRKYEPEMAAHIDAMGAAVGSPDFKEVLKTEFEQIVGKSIDYAVMERHDNVAVIEAPFAWDDVGSWQAIARLNPADSAGNSIRGLHVGIDTRHSIIFGPADHAIVTIDIDDLIVVHTANATLVAPRSSEERVREAVKQLEARGLDSFL
jgi:mannose-1-phosphate guanylyltransferase